MLTPPAALEALLFASGEPIEKKRLIALLGLKESELKIALKVLKTQLDGHGVSIIETEGEIEMRTAPKAAVVVKKLRDAEFARDLGRASMETLAAIAYQDRLPALATGQTGGRQGATRGEIDWVRGVNSSTSLRTLLLRGLIEGREDERDKRRMCYGLTTEALAYLGITSAEELPRFTELVASSRVALEEGKEEII